MKIKYWLPVLMVVMCSNLFAFDDCDNKSFSYSDRELCRIANNLEINIIEQKKIEELTNVKLQAYQQQAFACEQVDKTIRQQLNSKN